MNAHPYDEKTVARFWSKVDKNGPVPSHCPELGPCWVWLAGRHPFGYGLITVTSAGKKRHIGAHRMSWEIHNAEQVPQGLCVCHKCDNAPCVNPAHLIAETQGYNVRDAFRKKRAVYVPGKNFAKGERHGGARLTEDQVKDIIRRRSTTSAKQIAAEYGIGLSTAEQIRSRMLWKHVVV